MSKIQAMLFFMAFALPMLLIGVFLLRRYDKGANYSGIGSPYPWYCGLLYQLGTVLIIVGGMFLLLALSNLL